MSEVSPLSEAGAQNLENSVAVQAKTTEENLHATYLQTHFAIPIYHKLLHGFDAHQAGLMALMDEWRSTRPGLQRSNHTTWHSETTFHLQQNEHIQWFTQQVGVLAQDCALNTNPDLKNYDIIMDSCWANIAEKGGWNEPHNHYPAQWSGIYYVSVEDTVNLTDRNDKAGKIDFMNPVLAPGAFGQPTSVTYTPRNGLLIMFPALLQHFVHPFLNDSKRYTLAFNVNIVLHPPSNASTPDPALQESAE